jgi:hypothetical protein
MSTLIQELLALTEAKNMPYQVRVGSGDWKDIELQADSIEDIAKAVSASPMDDAAHEKFGLHQLTELVEDYIGVGPSGPGSSWDEIDFDVSSLKDDVLKLTYDFGGVNMKNAKRDGGYGSPVHKSGIITIMPGN